MATTMASNYIPVVVYLNKPSDLDRWFTFIQLKAREYGVWGFIDPETDTEFPEKPALGTMTPKKVGNTRKEKKCCQEASATAALFELVSWEHLNVAFKQIRILIEASIDQAYLVRSFPAPTTRILIRRLLAIARDDAKCLLRDRGKAATATEEGPKQSLEEDVGVDLEPASAQETSDQAIQLCNLLDTEQEAGEIPGGLTQTPSSTLCSSDSNVRWDKVGEDTGGAGDIARSRIAVGKVRAQYQEHGTCHDPDHEDLITFDDDHVRDGSCRAGSSTSSPPSSSADCWLLDSPIQESQHVVAIRSATGTVASSRNHPREQQVAPAPPSAAASETESSAGHPALQHPGTSKSRTKYHRRDLSTCELCGREHVPPRAESHWRSCYYVLPELVPPGARVRFDKRIDAQVKRRLDEDAKLKKTVGRYRKWNAETLKGATNSWMRQSSCVFSIQLE